MKLHCWISLQIADINKKASLGGLNANAKSQKLMEINLLKMFALASLKVK